MCSPDMPDTSKADANAARITELSEDQFNWVKEQWVADAPNREIATKRAGEVSDAQLKAMNQQIGLTEEGARDYRTIYRPAELKAAAEAANWDTDTHQEELAGKAGADVAQAFGAAREGEHRDMARYGVNPADGAYRGISANLAANEALGTAFAKNKARDDATTLGRALRSDVIATGRGVVGSQGSQTALALNAGNAAAGSAAMPTGITAQGVGMVQNAAGQTMNGLNSAGGIYMNSARMREDAANSGSNAKAGLAGAAMTAAAVF